MATALTIPDVASLPTVADALRTWQVDKAPMQLHPGDLGWHWRDGSDRIAADLRVWTLDGRIAAVGLLDAPQLLRMAMEPGLQTDPEFVGLVRADIEDPGRGVLDAGSAIVEARCGSLLRATLAERGWVDDEAWSPLHRDLAEPLPDHGLRIETIGPDGADEWLAVHWSAFRGTDRTDEERIVARTRWDAMAASPPYADARCLTAYDDDGVAVAVAGVWSAGPGRPGLIEPMGVQAEQRGRGYGTAMTVAAMTALQEMGSSSATVCTPSANPGAVETYVAAGLERAPEWLDLRRPA